MGGGAGITIPCCIPCIGGIGPKCGIIDIIACGFVDNDDMMMVMSSALFSGGSSVQASAREVVAKGCHRPVSAEARGTDGCKADSVRIGEGAFLSSQSVLFEHVRLPSRFVHAVVEPVSRVRARLAPRLVLVRRVEIKLEQAVPFGVFEKIVDVER